MPHTTWILYLTVALVPLARASTVDDQASVSDISAKLNASHPWIRVPLSDQKNSSRDSEPGVVSSVYSWLGSMFEGSPDPKRDEDEEKKVWTQRNGASQQEEQLEKTGRTTLPSANQSYHRQPDRRPVFLPESISILENLVHPEEEVQDEANDAEIFRAVVTSLAEWNLQKILRRKEQRRHRRDEDIDYSNLQQPSPSEELNTRFLLYTRRNPDVPHIMTHSNANSIRTSPYNSSLPSKIIIHGFGGSCQRIWAKQMRKTLINVEDVNVICVDWENGANLPNYKRAADNTRLVGRDVGQLIGQLNNMTGSKNGDFHLIGFSLGAHVAGFAGSEVRNQTQSLLHRITGLDPAGPLFENDGPQDRLDSGDADLVDVIHSNGEKIYMGGLGAWAPMGDIDFYPNGGRMQKGCTNLFVGAVTDMIWSSAEENGRSLCNHRRAYKFFTDSVASGCHFPAFACESYEKLLEGDCFPCVNNQCASMGYYADKSAGRGIMYLATREEEPFCANQYRVQLESTARPQPISSLGKIELILIGTNGFNFTEPFTLTKGPDFELVSGGKLVRLIVPHPNFSPPTIAQLTYTAYHGWISSGLPEWSVDKLMMTDSFGSVVSYCLKGTVLKSGKPMLITLQAGDCNPARAPVMSNVLPRQPFEPTLQAMDNEIPVLELHRTASFRSLDNATGNPIFSNSSATNDKVSPASASPANSGANSGPAAPTLPVASRSNVTNIFPYGNVPLSLLQQQIPADIKVANRRPSFYQWPFVGASHAANFLFGNHGNQVRARLKSLGGGRKQEPNLQLTPPSLQNSVATKDAPTTPPGPRRPYFRRNQGQQLNIDEQNRAQYFLMRQQQLHLQQQQQLQQARQQPAAVNPSAVYSNQQPNLGIQFGPQVAAGALPQPVMHLQSPNNQRGYLAQPSGFQWRPENAFNNPAIRFPLSPALKADPTVSMPLDHMQQTFAQTLLSQNNQQHTESAAPSVRNQPQLPFTANPPAQPGGPVIIIASSIPLTGDDLVAVTPALATAYPTTSSSLPPSTSVATVTTMTILNTPQHSASSSTVAASDVVTVSSTRTVPKLTESTDGELHESESVQTALTTNSKGVGTEAEAAEVVAQLATKSAGNRETGNVPSVPSINLKPPPVEERPVVYVPVEEVPVLVDPAGFLNATITSAVDPINGKSDDDVERLPYALPANPSMPTPPWTLFADNERTEVPPFVRYDFTNNGDVGGFLPEELYPNPQQLGQARDQYWATPRARRINNPTVGLYPVIQQFLTQPPPPPPPQSFAVAGGSAGAGAAKWEDVNKPRYIPLNPVDRQNRQLRMQYYVDTSNKPAELHTTTSTSVL